MKKLTFAVLATITFATWSSAELVENGNFADGVSYWRVGVAKPYGNPDPIFQVVEGALEGSRLHSANSGYLNIAQAVNIRKGKRYKLTYDVKGVGDGKYVVTVQHVNHGNHHRKRQELPGASWQTVEMEFEGAYDTDEKWFKKWRSATKSNKLKNNRTASEKLQKIKPVELNAPPTRTTLIYSIGDIAGSFAIRNVSIVEVP